MRINDNDYPVLIMGDAVTDFKKEYNGPIVSVKDIAELKEIIAYYSGISKLDRQLVIEDISFLGKDANTTLLKFVEECKLDLILLSKFDKMDEVLLSRIKRIIKYSKIPTESRFLRCSEGLEQMEESLSPDSHYFDRVRYMGKLAPKLILLDKTVKVKRIKNKIASFID